MEMKTIEEKLEVQSISNDSDNDVLVKLDNRMNETSTKNNFNKTDSILDLQTRNISISIPLNAIQKDKQTSQYHQQRPNKLSRSRPSANQQKMKTSNSTTEISLMSLDTPALKLQESNSSKAIQSNSSYASTTLTLAQSIPSTSYAQDNSSSGNTTSFKSILQNPPRQKTTPSTSQNEIKSSATHTSRIDSTKSTIQDGTTKVTVVQPSTVNSNTNSFEPELVLSPSKLGQ